MFWIGHSEFVNISNSVLLHVARLENITIPDYQVNYKLLFNDLANLLDHQISTYVLANARRTVNFLGQIRLRPSLTLYCVVYFR